MAHHRDLSRIRYCYGRHRSAGFGPHDGPRNHSGCGTRRDISVGRLTSSRVGRLRTADDFQDDDQQSVGVDVVYDVVRTDSDPPRLRGSSQLARAGRVRISGQSSNGAGKPASHRSRQLPKLLLRGGSQLHAVSAATCALSESGWRVVHLLLPLSGVQFREELAGLPTAVPLPLPA